MDIPISIDTDKAAVARAAVEAGADLVNDVSAGLHDADMIRTCAELQVPMVFMHMRGTSSTMTQLTEYSDDLVSDVAQELRAQLDLATECIPLWAQWIDPGIGFAKTADQNLRLLHPENLKRFKGMLDDRTMLVGVSRKRFLSGFVNKTGGDLGKDDILPRDWLTAGACCAAVAGHADVIRVHNVTDIKRACDVMKAALASPL